MTQTQQVKNTSTERRYGLLSILSMIVGIVIGSGIFVKNQYLYSTTNSSLMSISAWIFMTIIILFMVVAFIEITSISKFKKEQSTMHSWSTDLIGPKFGKIVGYFYIFVYFPILVVALANYATTEVMNTVAFTSGYSLAQTSPWAAMGIKLNAVLVVFVGFSLLNMFTSKPGKIFQMTGTSIMLIPLLLLTFTSVVIVTMDASGLATNAGQSGNEIGQLYGGMATSDTGAMWSLNSEFNTANESGQSLFKLFILALPGVMFAYDGFIWTASISNEAKSEKTFKLALIVGILLVAFLYISLSWAIFSVFPYVEKNGIEGYQQAGQIVNGSLVTVSDTSQLSVTAAFLVIFPNAQWLAILISLTIVTAIFTTLSGTVIVTARNVSSLSEKNMILDKHGKYLQRNKVLVPENSAIFFLQICVAWYVLFAVFDSINLAVFIGENGSSAVTTNQLMMTTNYSTNIISTVSYFILCALLVGGLMNRKTNKVKVQKTKTFIPFAVLSAAIMFVVTGYYGFLQISPFGSFGADGSLSMQEWVNWGLNLALIFAVAGIIGGAYWFYNKELATADKQVFHTKETMIHKYLDLDAWDAQHEKHIDAHLPTTIFTEIVDHKIEKKEKEILRLSKNMKINMKKTTKKVAKKASAKKTTKKVTSKAKAKKASAKKKTTSKKGKK